MKNKSVKKSKQSKKLVWFVVLSLGVLILVLNTVQIVFLSENTKKSVDNGYTIDCSEIVEGNSRAIQEKLASYMKQMYLYVNADVVKTCDRQAIVDWMIAHSDTRSSDFDYIMFCQDDGIAYTDIGTHTDINSRSYFKAILKNGQDTFIDDPVISKTTGKPVFHVTMAAKVNGRTIGLFAGVVNLSDLQKSVDSIKIGRTGYALMVASDGTCIAHQNSEYEMNMNFLTSVGSKDTEFAKVVRRMCNREIGYSWIKSASGFGKDLIVYAPIEGVTWSFGVSISGAQVSATSSELTKMMILTGILIGLILVIVASFIIVISLKPLESMKKSVNEIATGNADLTQRLVVKSDNEIGEVEHGFNSFIEKLQSIMVQLKSSKEVLKEAGDNLHSSAEDTEAAISQIIANIESMKNDITNQSAGVEETAGAVNEIASNIQSLEKMIENQSAGVTQASAAVEEMIGNISSVNASVEKMALSFQTLEKNALDGASKQQDVNARIEQIKTESKMLQEANSAIANIASQTNLLAMNAAIEAAHAGNAGKGFSVVADEIRKLSETSSSQSKTIGDQLKKIQDSINGVVTASAESSSAFSNVATEIHSTDAIVQQIKGAMAEQQEGSKQIGEALHSMNDSTSEVRTASSEMSAGNKAILEEVKNLQEATMNMKDNMSEMDIGAKKINETGKALEEITDKMKDSINKIGDQIDLFKV